MKTVHILPLFTGCVCIAENNIVISNVTEKGHINIISQKKKRKVLSLNIPFIRGVEYFLKMIYLFFFFLVNNYFNKKNNNLKTNIVNTIFFLIMILSISILYSFLFIGYLPNILGFAIFKDTGNILFVKMGIAVFKVLFLICSFLVIKFFQSIKKMYRFNYAIKKILSEEKNCGIVNFLGSFYGCCVLWIFITTLIGLELHFIASLCFNLLILLLIFSFVFEICAFFEKKGIKVCFLANFCAILSCIIANKTEMQVVQGANTEGKLMMENENRLVSNIEDSGAKGFAYVLSEVKQALKNNNINETSEAEWLIANVLNCKKFDLKFVNSISKTQYKEIQRVLNRRLKGEPIDKIFGYKEFYGLKILVNKNVLSPRQETEILVEETLKIIGNEKVDVLDLCTGSGAIAISLAKNCSNAKIFASDISEDALSVAKENAEFHKVKIVFKLSNLFEKLKTKKFDIIVSNPPYIKSEDIAKLDVEVKNYDPFIALDGGNDGLDFYRLIINQAPKHLNTNGKILFEVGYNQANKVKKLLTDNFINIKIVKDYNSVARFIIATKK